jgi:hypothetical protein
MHEDAGACMYGTWRNGRYMSWTHAVVVFLSLSKENGIRGISMIYRKLSRHARMRCSLDGMIILTIMSALLQRGHIQQQRGNDIPMYPMVGCELCFECVKKYGA